MSIVAQVNAELLKWANQSLFQWQQEAFRRLLSKSDLSSQDKDDLYERALFDLGIKKSEKPLTDVALTAADLPSGYPIPVRIYLASLKQLQNVNALKPGQQITFSKYLTVIYGDNASGKSGYVRLMKAACAAKAVDQILPDVFGASLPADPPSGVFEIETASGMKAIPWEKGKSSPGYLQRFRVFDSKCGKMYVNEGNQISFAPIVFEVLNKLGIVTQEIKHRFETLASSLAPSPDSLDLLKDDTVVGKAITSLSQVSDPKDVIELAKWAENDATNLKTQQEQLNSLLANSPEKVKQDLESVKKHLLLVKKHLKEIEEGISNEAAQDIKAKQTDVATFEQASKAAAQLAFADTQLDGIGGTAWRELILIAAKYSTNEAYPGQSFPPTQEGARCVLCLQPLTQEAHARLKIFWDFVQDETAQKRKKAEDMLLGKVNDLGTLPHSLPTPILAIEDLLHQSHPLYIRDVKNYFAAAFNRLTSIENAIKTNDWDTLVSMPTSLFEKTETEIEGINCQINKIVTDNATKKLIESVSREVAEMKARERLKDNLNLVLNYLKSLKGSAVASAIAGSIHTNTISITARIVHKKFVTDAYSTAVKTELESLGVHRARANISERSERGKVLHNLTVGDAIISVSPESVFSEGERTALALACFLSDLGPVEETCGIILDDPLTSLDHRVREGVIKRLLEEAKCRQVVVFTHDLPFYCELLKAADKEQVECKVLSVESFSKTVGHVSENLPWDALKVGQRTQQLDRHIKEAEDADQKGNSNLLRERIDIFYRHLRSTWERAVEELLFNRVIERYDRAVKTLSLAGVVVDQEGLTAIHTGMTRCSKFIHDQPAPGNFPLPTIDEMRSDLKSLKDFATSQNAKRIAADNANTHLKK